MNYFQSIYAYLYHYRIKEGHPPSQTPFTANIVVSCCLVMLVFALGFTLVLLISPFADLMEDILGSWFGRRSGKTIGRLLGLALLALLFPLVSKTIGTQKSYEKIISQFKGFEDVKKDQIAKTGSRFMLICLASLAVPLLLSLVM